MKQEPLHCRTFDKLLEHPNRWKIIEELTDEQRQRILETAPAELKNLTEEELIELMCSQIDSLVKELDRIVEKKND